MWNFVRIDIVVSKPGTNARVDRKFVFRSN